MVFGTSGAPGVNVMLHVGMERWREAECVTTLLLRMVEMTALGLTQKLSHVRVWQIVQVISSNNRHTLFCLTDS